jgi:hypothetical protein
VWFDCREVDVDGMMVSAGIYGFREAWDQLTKRSKRTALMNYV